MSVKSSFPSNGDNGLLGNLAIRFEIDQTVKARVRALLLSTERNLIHQGNRYQVRGVWPTEGRGRRTDVS